MRRALLALLLYFWTSAAFASFNVGYNVVPTGGNFALGTGDTFFGGGPYTMSQDGILQSVSYWANGATGGNNFLGVYADNGSNKPSTLIATSAAATLASGWNTFTMTTNPTITRGTKIWFAILAVTVSPSFENDAGKPSNICWYDTGDTTLPASFTGTNTFSNSTGGLYATFNELPNGMLPLIGFGEGGFFGGNVLLLDNTSALLTNIGTGILL